MEGEEPEQLSARVSRCADYADAPPPVHLQSPGRVRFNFLPYRSGDQVEWG